MNRTLAIAALLAAVVRIVFAAIPLQVRTFADGQFEASGATRVPGGDGFLFIDDGRPRQVFCAQVRADGQADAVEAVQLGGAVIDPEGITNDGAWVYVVGSQSRGGNKGADLLRFRFDPRTRRASNLEALGGLPELLHGIPEIASAGGKKRAAVNIEGLAWDAGRKTLLLGLRSPLAGADALVVPLTIQGDALAPGSAAVGPARRVLLGGRGIRSIEQAPEGGFLIVAGGAYDAGRFSLFSWDGQTAPRLVQDFPAALKPEGVARVAVGGSVRTLLLGDSGRYAVLD
jgi:hypothetical protein